jgi:hypothetical protein|tara:strand:+ start:106 stop:261 length:156 start_codon:yes stop_codon:yes gene_type:complete
MRLRLSGIMQNPDKGNTLRRILYDRVVFDYGYSFSQLQWNQAMQWLQKVKL